MHPNLKSTVASMDQTLKDFLRNEVIFPSPTTKSYGKAFRDVNEEDVRRLMPEWKPTVARHNPHMVDALVQTIEEYLGDRPLPDSIKEMYEYSLRSVLRRFEENTSEHDAMMMVKYGAIYTADSFLDCIGCRYDLRHRKRAQNFTSRIGMIFDLEENESVLIEVVDPYVMDKILAALQSPELHISLVRGRPPGEKVLNTVSVFMGAYKARWLALTSHDKWIFFHLHNDAPETYLTFSSVEHQTNNSRPLLVLLGMLVAAGLGIEVRC